jgi:hypothetical protein
MCTTTKIKLSDVTKMANEFMSKTYVYNGKVFNLIDMGWSFKYNVRKSSLGICSVKLGVKTIQLSKWFIQNSKDGMGLWEDTMLHEIAHAIDMETRGSSSHDEVWRSIALSIGCNGKRCGDVDFKENVTSKYTLVCGSCDFKEPSHKKKRRSSSCPNCSGGSFNEKYILKQTQNY